MPGRQERSQHRRDLVAPVVAGGAVILCWATVAGSHTNPAFHRVRQLDRTSLIVPNWRFFAPLPAKRDNHLLFRTSTRGEPTLWEEVRPIAPRRWLHAVWFPERRRDKGLFDLYSDIAKQAETVEARRLARTPPYRIMHGLVAERVRAVHAGRELPEQFQFALVNYSGVDDSEEPEYIMVSPWVPTVGPAAAQDACRESLEVPVTR